MELCANGDKRLVNTVLFTDDTVLYAKDVCRSEVEGECKQE